MRRWASLGSVLTYLHQGDLGSTLDGLTSNIVQPYLILFSTLMLIKIIGLRTVAWLGLSGAALTGLVALLQFANIEIGWRLREILGEIQNEPAEIQSDVAGRGRAVGLSLSPIVFSYHIISAYLALNVMYRFGQIRPLFYYGSFFMIVVAFLANGTRSAILAILASEMLMQLRQGTTAVTASCRSDCRNQCRSLLLRRGDRLPYCGDRGRVCTGPDRSLRITA